MATHQTRSVDVETFPHNSNCTGADLRHIMAHPRDYWLCRGCSVRGVKIGDEYRPYSIETSEVSHQCPECGHCDWHGWQDSGKYVSLCKVCSHIERQQVGDGVDQ